MIAKAPAPTIVSVKHFTIPGGASPFKDGRVCYQILQLILIPMHAGDGELEANYYIYTCAIDGWMDGLVAQWMMALALTHTLSSPPQNYLLLVDTAVVLLCMQFARF